MLQKKTMDMTEGVIWKELVMFSLPLLMGNVFQQLYNTVDSIVVGNFVGAHALGAVTSVAPAINTLIGFFTGLSTGASVVISQYFGAKNETSLRKAVHTALAMTLILAIFFSILGVCIAPTLLRFMHTPPELLADADTYLKIYFAGIIGLMLYNMGSGILRAVGDSKRPLYFLILSSILNIILDLLFVLVFHLGVAGVAYATIFSQLISDIFIFVLLFRTKECYGITLKEMRVDTHILKQIFFIGLPAGIQMALISFSNVFVQAYINNYGASSTSGWGVYNRLDSLVNLPMQSISLAITTFTGQNAGAEKPERIKQGIRQGMAISISITVLICVLMNIWTREIISLFNRDEGVLAYGSLFIHLLTPFTFLCCMNQIHAGVLRGVGNAKIPMFIMIFSFVVFRQIYLAIVSRITPSIYPIALGYPAGWIVCSILMGLYFRHSGWEKRIKAPTVS